MTKKMETHLRELLFERTTKEAGAQQRGGQSFASFLPRNLFPKDEQGSRDKVRRVGADERPHDHGENEPPDALGAEDEQDEEHDERSCTGIQRAAEGLLEAALREFFEIPFPAYQEHVIAHAVENHDHVVYGVSHDGEQRRHEESINLEGRVVTQYGEDEHQKQGKWKCVLIKVIINSNGC